jgi:hypothetical protein
MGKRLPAGVGMRAHRAHHHVHHHAHVGDAPVGFAPIFQGWNVWDVWAADDPDKGLLTEIWEAGESPERVLRVWIEDQIKDNAPGAAVADPANPAALKGAQIQPIPHVPFALTSGAAGLAAAATRGDMPEFAGALQLGKTGSKATLHTFRFYNRGTETVMPWAHDQNFILERVYQPSPQNPVTNSPAPSSLAGAASGVADAAASAVKVVAIGAGVVLGVVLLVSLINSSKKVAA